MATITGIYCIRHRESGKSYIGQSVNIKRRWAAHKRGYRKGYSAVAAAIAKHGFESFDFEIIETCEKCDLNKREIHWVSALDTVAPNGYNLTSGGFAPEYVSAETRQRQASAQRGKVHPREVVEKRRQAVIGQKRSAETLAKMSASQRGKKASPETIEKLRLANLGRPSWNKGKPMREDAKIKLSKAKTGVPLLKKRKPVLRDDGVVFDSLNSAAEAIGATYRGIIRVLKGERRKIYGWSFSYHGGASSQP